MNLYNQVQDKIVSQSASRLNDSVQQEMRFLTHMGWSDAEVSVMITLAVEFLLSHLE